MPKNTRREVPRSTSADQPNPAPRSLFNRLFVPLVVLLLAGACVLGYLAQRTPSPSPPPPPAAAPAAPTPAPAQAPAPPVAALPVASPSVVDEQACAGCHAPQVKDWHGSHHQLAMQPANAQSVAGNFDDTTFKGEKETTRFFRRGADYWVNTVGADGRGADFKVAYAFGVAPLQQYLLDTGGGHLQALGVAWDTEQRRWFHIYPGQGVDLRSPLHWSKPGQNANFMCVECHTTGFKRNFDAASNTFNSQWNSLGVGCQACHGPASNHLLWAAKGQARPPGGDVGLVVNLSQASNVTQVDTCARCHARRAPLGDDSLPGKPLMEAYLPSALTRELYEVDGKIKGEVFEHGSFLQSRMFAKGVACSACHNPHSGELKASGNGVCLQCHNTAGKTAVPGVDGAGLQARDYTSVEHTHHAPGQAGSQCVDCHMPGKLFMVNDLRHDHSFSLPNPALAQKLGTPDACLGCHLDLPVQQVIDRYQQWYGSPQNPTFAYAQSLWQVRGGQPGAADTMLGELAAPTLAAIRRATLVAELPDYPSQRALEAAAKALHDPNAQVREAAVKAVAAQLPAQDRVQLLGPLLEDPLLAVRLAAVGALLAVHEPLGPWQAAFDKGTAQYEQVQLSLQERAEANLNLAMLYQARGNSDKVEPYLRAAIARDADFAPAVVTLGQWLESRQRPDEALALLAEQVARTPDNALLQFTQGLTLIRRNSPQPALAALREANRLEPDNARYAYVLALSLQGRGDADGARALLQDTLARHPQNREVRMALVAQQRDEGNVPEMKRLIDQLKAINPQDPLLGSH